MRMDLIDWLGRPTTTTQQPSPSLTTGPSSALGGQGVLCEEVIFRPRRDRGRTQPGGG